MALIDELQEAADKAKEAYEREKAKYGLPVLRIWAYAIGAFILGSALTAGWMYALLVK